MEYNIKAFVRNILEQKGVSGLPESVVEQMEKDLIERAERLVIAKIIERMPEGALEEFEKKIDDGNDEETQAFIVKYIPDINEVVAEALMRLKEIYLINTAE